MLNVYSVKGYLKSAEHEQRRSLYLLHIEDMEVWGFAPDLLFYYTCGLCNCVLCLCITLYFWKVCKISPQNYWKVNFPTFHLSQSSPFPFIPTLSNSLFERGTLRVPLLQYFKLWCSIFYISRTNMFYNFIVKVSKNLYFVLEKWHCYSAPTQKIIFGKMWKIS